LGKKTDDAISCPKLIHTLREMNVLEYENEGYIPTYVRTDITDQLHDIFTFRTDTEVVTIEKMKKILKSIKN